MLGSTPALVNPMLAVGSAGNTVTLATNLERQLGGSDLARGNASPKVSSRSVHGSVYYSSVIKLLSHRCWSPILLPLTL